MQLTKHDTNDDVDTMHLHFNGRVAYMHWACARIFVPHLMMTPHTSWHKFWAQSLHPWSLMGAPLWLVSPFLLPPLPPVCPRLPLPPRAVPWAPLHDRHGKPALLRCRREWRHPELLHLSHIDQECFEISRRKGHGCWYGQGGQATCTSGRQCVEGDSLATRREVSETLPYPSLVSARDCGPPRADRRECARVRKSCQIAGGLSRLPLRVAKEWDLSQRPCGLQKRQVVYIVKGSRTSWSDQAARAFSRCTELADRER